MRRLVVLLVVLLAAAWGGDARAADWCGTVAAADRPAALGGQHVRVLYALPSDGADASAEWAARIWADVETIDGWWRANDPARAPRFDVFPFACGLQADLTLQRLPETAAELVDNATRFDRIVDALLTGFDGVSKLLVYYDGPVSDDDLCGQGGGAALGAGIAVIYLAACGDVATAAVATHELLHAFGALPGTGPPNACEDDDAHVCDSSGDILYRFAQTAPISSLVLDLNRDDYYGHAGDWLDVEDSPWLRRLDAQVPLSVVVRGGGGVVTSDLPGIDCTSACTADFNPGTSVELTAGPREGRRFVRWSGACAGTDPACALTLDVARQAVALFAPESFRLTVDVKGGGRVTSFTGISCTRRCARPVESFTPVTLRARPAKGWRLKAWTGACRGAKATCRVPMTKASVARATFVRVAKR